MISLKCDLRQLLTNDGFHSLTCIFLNPSFLSVDFWEACVLPQRPFLYVVLAFYFLVFCPSPFFLLYLLLSTGNLYSFVRLPMHRHDGLVHSAIGEFAFCHVVAFLVCCHGLSFFAMLIIIYRQSCSSIYLCTHQRKVWVHSDTGKLAFCHLAAFLVCSPSFFSVVLIISSTGTLTHSSTILHTNAKFGSIQLPGNLCFAAQRPFLYVAPTFFFGCTYYHLQVVFTRSSAFLCTNTMVWFIPLLGSSRFAMQLPFLVCCPSLSSFAILNIIYRQPCSSIYLCMHQHKVRVHSDTGEFVFCHVAAFLVCSPAFISFCCT